LRGGLQVLLKRGRLLSRSCLAIHSGDIKESTMSKRKPKKRIVKKLLKKQKRSFVPNGKPVDISLEKKVKLPENFYQIDEKVRKELGLDEEELIIFL
jgi:hypothetical protein